MDLFFIVYLGKQIDFIKRFDVCVRLAITAVGLDWTGYRRVSVSPGREGAANHNLPGILASLRSTRLA